MDSDDLAGHIDPELAVELVLELTVEFVVESGFVSERCFVSERHDYLVSSLYFISYMIWWPLGRASVVAGPLGIAPACAVPGSLRPHPAGE